MRAGNWIALVAIVSSGMGPAFASDDSCEFRAERKAGIDAAGVTKIVLRTGAGDLNVNGRANTTRIEAHGTACAAKQALLDKVQLSVRREGNVVYLETQMPEDTSGWSWGRSDYANIDLNVSLPDLIAVDAVDSSGDATFEDLKSLTLQDSSGDLDLARIAGMADVGDSSGDLEIDNAGSVRVRDSSGDVGIEHVKGDVEVSADSSGDLEIAQVDGSVQHRTGQFRRHSRRRRARQRHRRFGQLRRHLRGPGARRLHGEAKTAPAASVTRRSAERSACRATTRRIDRASSPRASGRAASSGSSARRSACLRSNGPKLWRSKKSVSAETSGARRASSARATSSGMSQAISVSRRARNAASRCSVSFAASLPAPRTGIFATWSRLSYSSSSDANSFISAAAVYGAHSGTPLMLSTLSPMSARKSAKRSGATPNRSSIW